ncbi:polyunsaturated fatty acid lipoxygenase ALOX15B-like isoform X1 [Colossoma macropomum]|uniref:polyunsaturated fatty acid lipoxygenase ALOX15B-like isoform X1 n=1 Tax=Colossoma macropomum TaxID=42526 RepID=UPI001864A266|nr:polyunsaturated fatty acid lipoxygenase ALOX15B-like isoform X1 [Colossoma macropomum]XP_036430858.1 polyunsaturated fatty acid lipoxygenase ALOX15B-like isoform X1 [Colossoma macropomum]XP_036430859.1 polyunsaturated fatty acid lipoxygenase ALOX15B-like isoform X1 [Colossoma macropomum]
MVKYTVEVFTGDALNAGNANAVFIKLIGTKGSSEPQILGCFAGMLSCSKTLTVSCKESLGTFFLVQLELKALVFEDYWFCSKVIVTEPEGRRLLFPCYQWLSPKKKAILREATAKLSHKDTEEMAIRHRLEDVAKKREDFRWSVYDSEMPHIVQADSASSLPYELRFSFTKEKEFQYSLLRASLDLKLNNFHHPTNTWNSMEELEDLQRNVTGTHEYIKKHWMTDTFFGYQFLNGSNPMMIKRCSKLPKNFPVTNDMVKSSLPKESSLEKEMEKGNIFLCDYARLDGIVGNVIDGKQQYMAAPLCLLFSNPQGKLLPIAIQLKQKPEAENPIFLPTDSKHDWLLAKLFVRNAEFNEHELNFHLLRTHLLAEVFTMATLRALPSVHPLFKLLFPHIRYTLQINIMARKQLISADGTFAMHSAIGHKGLTTFLRRATAGLTYSSLCLPDNIKERGLENIPQYYYRDDGLKLWNIIHKFVHGVLAHYYTERDVQEDSELQTWLTEIVEHGFLKNDNSGIPKSFHTVAELVKFVTMLIFTVSAQHAAVNNGQFDFGAWMPNFPGTMKIPPPTRKGQATADSVVAGLPDVRSTLKMITAFHLLSKKSSDHYPLGYYPEELFIEAVPLQKIEQFRKDLKALEGEIEARNKNLELPYDYLNPMNVDNSVDV